MTAPDRSLRELLDDLGEAPADADETELRERIDALFAIIEDCDRLLRAFAPYARLAAGALADEDPTAAAVVQIIDAAMSAQPVEEDAL